MTSGSDALANRRAELARRLAALSPEQQAQVAGAAVAGSATAAAPQATITARASGDPIPMSFAQELLWGLERSSPGHVYNVPRAVRLAGELDIPSLQRALDALVLRHEALRSSFAMIDGEPRQIVNTSAPVVLEQFDVSTAPASERDGAAREQMRTLARQPFDLEHDALLRAALIRLDAHDHVLQLVSHHVVSDGWSGNIIMRELGALYRGFQSNTPVELAPLPVQYADFAVWQRRTISGERLEKLTDYWRTQLAGAATALELPGARIRTAAPSFEGAMQGIVLPASLLAPLHSLARSEGASSFMVLLSSLYALIHRYTREDELVIGTPVAGRSYPELEGVVGFFANTLLLRTSTSGNPTFRELLQRVRNTTLAAFDNQEIPLESLLLSKGTNDRPLAVLPQVVFSTEDPNREQLQLNGVDSSRIGVAVGGAKFDLHVLAAERPEGLRIGAEYRTDLFEAATIDRLLQHFGVILEGALNNPDAPISSLPIMSAQERALLLDEWNDTAVSYPESATLVSLFREQVLRTPNGIAVQEGGRSLTYEQLDRRTNALATKIRAKGATTGVLIGVCAERSVEMVLALLAVVKSGAAYVPLDPDYPAERLAFMLSDSATPIILTQTHLVSLLPAATLVLLDEESETRESEASVTWTPPAPDDAAYMIYTSGSTGMPKGALNSHRGIVNRLLWMQQQYALTPADVVLQKTPYSFDVSVWEFFWPLITGARIVMAEPGGHRDPVYLAGAIDEFGVTVMHFVPSMLRAFLTGVPSAARLSSLRHVMASGEALPADIVPEFRNTFGHAQLHNLYGPTECAVDVTHWTVPSEGVIESIPIGRPVANTQMYVLDANGAPTPIGVSGELHIGGVQVGMGYHKRPELTAEKFIADPFSKRSNAKLYRTGDLARWSPDGTIQYLGRLDFQVKLRGFRIELGEIESVIARHAAVADSIVVVQEVARGDQRLVAYVVVKTGVAAPTVADLRDWVRHTLPEHMVPATVVFLDRIPLTSSGKADRKALPAPQLVDQTRPHQSPRSTIEHEIVQIWERLLSPSRPISAFDDFFEIGGHSLLAIQMLADVERIRGQRIPLAWLFESSTVEALAARLSDTLFSTEEPPLVVLQPQGTATPVAFVHGDWTGGGWYSRRLAPLVAPDSPFYVLPTIGNDDDVEPWTIERMAARHVSELRKMQPAGPYRVVGFCVGGIVAYEMARQLQAAGEHVERLVLIDSSPMNARLRKFGALVQMLPASNASQRLQRQAELMRRVRWAHGRVAYFNNLPAGTKSQWIVEKFTKTLPRLLNRRRPGNSANIAQPANAAQTAPAPTAAPLAVAGDDANRDVLMLRTQARATSAYIPGRFTGNIDFVFAEGAPGMERRVSPVDRWQLLADSVRVRALPTGHISLITSELQMLAAALRDALHD